MIKLMTVLNLPMNILPVLTKQLSILLKGGWLIGRIIQ